MDFTATESQTDVAALTTTILEDHCTPERLRAVDAGGTRFDEALWRALGHAGLLGLPLPDPYGAGQGLLEVCSLLTEIGRYVAPVPVATHVVAAMAVARFGSSAQRAEWLPVATAGDGVLTVAVAEERESFPEVPSTRAEFSSGTWQLTGVKNVVTAGQLADAIVVLATAVDGITGFLVRPDDPGVSLSEQDLSDGDVTARLELDRAEVPPDRVLGGIGDAADLARWLHEHLTVAVCAQQFGTVRGALDLTAAYAGTREQFGRPIGTFQAVSQRLANGYIDVLGAGLTMQQAAWRLSEGLPAAREVATAKLWAADTGHALAHTTVHVHGGVGIDLDGAAHRYFTAAKRLEFALGGTTEQARRIGRLLAAEPG